MKKLAYAAGILIAIVAGAAAFVFNTAAGQDAAFGRATAALFDQTPAPLDGMRVVVCGSASPIGVGSGRAQACIAVVTAEHLLLFDVGARAPLRIGQARLPLERLTGVFLTHFHSDHIAGVPDVNLASWVRGRRAPLEIHGPAGVAQVVDGFNRTYALDRTYRVAHHGAGLVPPDAGPMRAVEIAPGQVAWRDDLLTVTSFTVAHPPVEPAVGYRVDYRGRSVVISGDTNVTDSLFDAARDADLLIHDALSRTLLDPLIDAASAANVEFAATLFRDVIDYHADATVIEQPAAAAGVRQLVLYHLVPTPQNALAERMFARGLSADTIIARDLHTFDLPPDSTEIRIREP